MNYYKVEIVFWRKQGDIDAVTLSIQATTAQAAERTGVEQAVARCPGRKVQAVDVVPFLGAYRVRQADDAPWHLALLDRVGTDLWWRFIGTDEEEGFATAGLEYQWLGSVEPLIASPVPVDEQSTPDHTAEHSVEDWSAYCSNCGTKRAMLAHRPCAATTSPARAKYKIEDTLAALRAKMAELEEDLRVLLLAKALLESERDDLDSENEDLVRQLNAARGRMLELEHRSDELEIKLRQMALEAEKQRVMR